MLRVSVSGNSKLCLECHEGKDVTHTPHNLLNDKSLSKAQRAFLQKHGECSACHIPHNPKGIYLSAFKVKKVSDNQASNICLSCHSKKGLVKAKAVKYYYHPSKMVVIRNYDRPGRKGDWPIFNSMGKKVNVNGQIACETCHDPHVWSKWESKGPSVTSDFLRNKDLSGSLCVDCHGPDALFRYKFFHDKNSHLSKPSYR